MATRANSIIVPAVERPAASQFSPEHLDIVREAARRAAERLEQRPFKGREGGSIILNNSACEKQCPTCRLECAILPERVAWWEKEVARVETAMGQTLMHNGVAYAVLAGAA